MSTPAEILHLHAHELTPELVQTVAELIQLVFPNPEVTVRERFVRYQTAAAAGDREAFIALREGRVLAHALIFPREIATARGRLRVMALAAVLSDPAHRGEGWGKAVTQAAFAEVDRGRFPVSLFQTGLPEFYAKLGARLVTNRFINSCHVPPPPGARGTHGSADEPWWNPHVMIYPAAFAWPEGTIDLLGPGF